MVLHFSTLFHKKLFIAKLSCSVALLFMEAWLFTQVGISCPFSSEQIFMAWSAKSAYTVFLDEISNLIILHDAICDKQFPAVFVVLVDFVSFPDQYCHLSVWGLGINRNGYFTLLTFCFHKSDHLNSTISLIDLAESCTQMIMLQNRHSHSCL